MKLPLHVAKKLFDLRNTASIPASSFSAAFTKRLLADGMLTKQSLGRTKYKLSLKNPDLLESYLKNQYGIGNLENYISALENVNLEGHEAVDVSSDSKIKKIRTFKGFLINSYDPLSCALNGKPFICNPQEGSFLFIHDFEKFNVPADLTIVGIENSENFRLIAKQKYLFKNIKPLFVSRYPQSGDLTKWLLSIDNSYIHYGDFDFAGISIYLHEYKTRLKERASFFYPSNIQTLIKENGSRKLYNKQLHLKDSIIAYGDEQVRGLIEAIDAEKKGLEQQILIVK